MPFAAPARQHARQSQGGLGEATGRNGLQLWAAPSAPARDDVDQRNEGDDDHHSYGHDGDSGGGDDHSPFLSCGLLVKPKPRAVVDRAAEQLGATSFYYGSPLWQSIGWVAP
jgi:hypothetical protein